jgi:tRNA pseudouridine32 synthase/23S rRNA pseudouridine746 synthase
VLRGPDEADDFANPLQLLARSLAFDDPVTGQQRVFVSQRSLCLGQGLACAGAA